VNLRAPAVAAAVGLTAFLLYRVTLLPGFDLGDTASFQTTVGERVITPRDGYPLYFAIGGLFVRLTGSEPAHALNLLSAIEASIACGIIVLAGAELSGSLTAGAAAALLFATSYTFWSQAIIGEVYALHLIFVSATLLLLLRWSNQPSLARLTLFFAVYALGFGNHLSMVLLLPAYTLFLLTSAPGGWRSMLAPRIVTIAIACAAAGALQYVWNLRTLWFEAIPPHGLLDALQAFWFDVTKSDWRDTMVLRVPQSMLNDRAAMYWFDLRQQFGIIGAPLAVAGLAHLASVDIRRALLMLLLYVVNVAFAYSYNVGDVHVFYLPSHLIVALLAAPALTLVRDLVRADLRAGTDRRVSTEAFVGSDRRVRPDRRMYPGRHIGRALRATVSALLMVYAIARAYRDLPALDRSADRRPTELLEQLTTGLDDRRDVYLTDFNWQIANGLSYYGKVIRPEIAYDRMPAVLLFAPALVADNRTIGRDIVLSERARAEVNAAYGPLLPTIADARVDVQPLTASIAGIARGTRYVLCVLRPSRDLALDSEELNRAWQMLIGDAHPNRDGHEVQATEIPKEDYAVLAGLVGERPQLVLESSRPFRRSVTLDGVDVEVRMESWLAADTIRRMGFGHVIAARHHTLIVERGVSFVAFDDQGRALRTEYRSNIFAPQRRYVIEPQR
jgi:Protein of unknown function (DUF2723)